jgi:SWI/SNF-related matrix-associated actin-dependent regulator 1 of chromatin subfamily A
LFEEEQVKNAKQIMKPFVLRRLKTEVLKDLPLKTTEVIVCPMIKEQKDMYTNLVAKFSAEADENDEVNGIGMMMQLRKLANHPLLLQNYYREDKLRVCIYSKINCTIRLNINYFIFIYRLFLKN